MDITKKNKTKAAPAATDMVTENDLKRTAQDLDAQIANANTDSRMAVDEALSRVNEYKAAQETPEQREARIKQEKATAAMSGAIEGIGNIFNMIYASKNKSALVAGGGAPVTQTLDNAIKQGAVERKEADDKLNAMIDKLNQLQMAHAQNNVANYEKLYNIKSGLFYKGKEDKRAEAEEKRKSEMHNEQLRGAKAQADAAETTARNAQQKYDDEHDISVAQQEHIQQQNESMQQNSELVKEQMAAKKRENEYWASHPEEFAKYMAGGNQYGRQENANEMNFIVKHPDGDKMMKWNPKPEDVMTIINRYPALSADYKAKLKIAQGRSKTNLTLAEKNEVARTVLKGALEGDYNLYKDIIEDVMKRVKNTDSGLPPTWNAGS